MVSGVMLGLKKGGVGVIKYTTMRGEAYHWGMLTWFNQFLLEQGVVTEGEFRQMRQRI